MWRIFLQTTEVVVEHFAKTPVFASEYVIAGAHINKTLVKVHSGTSGTRHGLRHERCLITLSQSDLTHHSFEHKHLIGLCERVTMIKIDF